jgi:hypothetical protein
MGLVVPFYAAPGPEFSALLAAGEADNCTSGSLKAAVLTGPASGPPDPASAAHRAAFAEISATKQWATLGYVFTQEGNRPLSDVLAAIDVWLAPGAAGFGDLVEGGGGGARVTARIGGMPGNRGHATTGLGTL